MLVCQNAPSLQYVMCYTKGCDVLHERGVWRPQLSAVQLCLVWSGGTIRHPRSHKNYPWCHQHQTTDFNKQNHCEVESYSCNFAHSVPGISGGINLQFLWQRN